MICSDCGRDHSHQFVDYPEGATVITTVEIWGSVDTTEYKPLEGYYPHVLIPAGSKGHVRGHHDDGRAIVEFEAEIGKSPAGHTFHYPEGYFMVAVGVAETA